VGAGAAPLALISDIHGNLVALDGVLADLRRRGVDRIVCLGDVAATGPQPAEAIERIGELGCPVVMGNTDEFLLDPVDDGTDDSEDWRRIVEIDIWCAGRLEEHHRELVRGYRPVVALDGVVCYHGTPRSNTEQLHADTPAAQLGPMLAGYEGRIFAGGHTHVAMLRRHQGAIVINPGSVGMPFEAAGEEIRNPPWAEYAIVRGSDVEFIRVPVGVEAIVSAATAGDMPHAAWWIKDWSWG
jgi:predicted phosphodiesterase